MKAITSIKCAVTIASLSTVGFFTPTSVQAVQLTYDLRVLSSSSGDPVTDPHIFAVHVPGEVVTIGIYAVINGQNSGGTGGHLDDGFTSGYGSLISGGTPGNLLQGNLRGDTAAATTTNNAQFFNGLGAQSGYLADLDADGDLDIGTNLTTSPTTPPWFVAISVNTSGTAPVLGGQIGLDNSAGTTSFLIGQTTFTVTGALVSGQLTNLQFLPRVRTDGGVVGNKVHKFTLDGVNFSLVGSDTTNIHTIGTSIFFGIPEPSAIGMLLLGTVGLVGFRRSAFRRLVA